MCPFLIFPALLALGFWQLDRADQKRTQQASIIQRQVEAPLVLNQKSVTVQDQQKILWRRVIANGYFDEDIQLLLDNQVLNGQAGYFVYTPFQLTGDKDWFLVNRGWVPAGGDRTRVPELHKTTGQISILGTLKEIPKTGVLLKEVVTEQIQRGVYRLQAIDPRQIEVLINGKLIPFVIRLAPDSDYGYIRDWSVPGSPEIGVETHLGYAFQWFALAITVVVIYTVVNLKKTSDS